MKAKSFSNSTLRLFTVAILLSFVATLNSCSNVNTEAGETVAEDGDYKVIKVDGLYSMTLPTYMKKTVDLNEEASLQYQNIFKEAYIIVIEEPIEDIKSTFTMLGLYEESLSALTNYRNIQMGMIAENINITKQEEPKNMLINTLRAEMVEMDGLVEGIDEAITYYITFLEGRENVYMMMAWTLKDKKEKLRSDYEKMFSSFRLLSPEEAEEKILNEAAEG